jgi:hypothetical protein
MTFFVVTVGVVILAIFGVGALRAAYMSWRDGEIVTFVGSIFFGVMFLGTAIYLLIGYPIAILGLLVLGSLFVAFIINDSN